MKVYVVIDSSYNHIEKIFDSFEKAKDYAFKTYDVSPNDENLEIYGEYIRLDDAFKIEPWEVE